jgi:hypothetical protein
MTRLNGFKPDWAERIQRGRTKAFGKGYIKGAKDEQERIVGQLLVDSLIITNLDTDILERIVNIVEAQKD